MLNLFIVYFVFLLSREFVLLNEELFFIFSFALFFILAFNTTALLLSEFLDQKADEIFATLAFTYKKKQLLLRDHKKHLASNLQFFGVYLDLLLYTVEQLHIKEHLLNNQAKQYLFFLVNQHLKFLLNVEFILQRSFLERVAEQAIKHLHFKLTSPFYFARQYPGSYFYVFDKYVYGFTPFMLEHMFTELTPLRNMFCFRSRLLLIVLAVRFKKPFLIFIK